MAAFVKTAAGTCRLWVVIANLPVAAACTFNMTSRTKTIVPLTAARDVVGEASLSIRDEWREQNEKCTEKIYLLESVAAMM